MASRNIVSGKKIRETVNTGERIYERVKIKYLKEHKGEFLTIDPKSGDVFWGKTSISSYNKAKRAYPDGFFIPRKLVMMLPCRLDPTVTKYDRGNVLWK